MGNGIEGDRRRSFTTLGANSHHSIPTPSLTLQIEGVLAWDRLRFHRSAETHERRPIGLNICGSADAELLRSMPRQCHWPPRRLPTGSSALSYNRFRHLSKLICAHSRPDCGHALHTLPILSLVTQRRSRVRLRAENPRWRLRVPWCDSRGNLIKWFPQGEIREIPDTKQTTELAVVPVK
jgi:hypothetical protein